MDFAFLLSPLKTALVASITPGQIVAILASIIGVGMTFVLMWFGVRKLLSIFKKAVLGYQMTTGVEKWQRKQYKYSVKHEGYTGSYNDYWGI